VAAIATTPRIHSLVRLLWVIGRGPRNEAMDMADRIREILRTRGLSLYRVSERSREMSSPAYPCHIPHNLYSDVRVARILPNIYQLAALSRISNHRLADWLAVFGFHLDDIPRISFLLPSKRTVILDSSVYDDNAWIPWFRERLNAPSIAPIAPLGQILEPGTPKRARELLDLNRTRYLYAKIGEADLLAFPDFVPGSIVRVDPRGAAELPPEEEVSKRHFLVEDDAHLSCCRLRRVSKDRVVVCSTRWPFAQFEPTVARDVRIYGVVDPEIRPMASHTSIRASLGIDALQKPGNAKISPPGTLQALVRSSRIRAGLSFREASRKSRRIAELLQDDCYFTAVGTLSDYETLSGAPRHVQKIISLSILYSIRFWDFLRLAGLLVAPLGEDPIPDELVPRAVPLSAASSLAPITTESARNEGHGFLRALIEQWGEIPLFLAKALGSTSGIKGFSLSDVFWVGGDPNPIHPWLAHAAFVIVNRRMRRPAASTATMFWEQPLFLVLKRDGTYVCGSCTSDEGFLVIHPYHLLRSLSPWRLRNGIDAEVVGRVMVIVRRIS
jgi:hypothetical protein